MRLKSKIPLLTLIKLRIKLFRLNMIPNINAGGCAIVASHLYKYLCKEAPGSSLNIIYAISETSQCSHAVVELNGTLYDSTGIVKVDDLLNWNERIIGLKRMRPKLVKHHLLATDWNKDFNRDKYEKKYLKF